MAEDGGVTKLTVITGFQAGWFKAALARKGPVYSKTIVAKML